MKRIIAVLLSCIMLCSQAVFVFAADDAEKEHYEMVEISDEEWVEMGGEIGVMPSLLYIANIITSIVKVSSSQVSIRAETVCSEKVKSITVVYILQKWNGSKWVNVISRTDTVNDATTARKTYSITGLGSGSYRCKASAKVTGYSGYSETLAGYSASINL